MPKVLYCGSVMNLEAYQHSLLHHVDFSCPITQKPKKIWILILSWIFHKFYSHTIFCIIINFPIQIFWIPSIPTHNHTSCFSFFDSQLHRLCLNLLTLESSVKLTHIVGHSSSLNLSHILLTNSNSNTNYPSSLFHTTPLWSFHIRD